MDRVRGAAVAVQQRVVPRVFAVGAAGVMAAVLLAVAPRPAPAQGADGACTYAKCALNIVPRLTGLDVVRGEQETRLATLAFLWPSNVRRAFVDYPAGAALAAHAVRERRIGMALTNGGAILVAAGLARALHDGGRLRGGAGFVALGGMFMVGISVPVHFAADADLSRAVWQSNAAFSR